MQEHFLKERGLAYQTNALQPARTTLLLVHGLSGSSSAWEPYEKLLSGYNLVAPDLRGHGLSERRDYALPEFVEDLRALLAHLGVARCAVVSHSFGALVAVAFVRAHPELAERVVLLAPPYGVQRFWASRLFFGLCAALAVVPLRLRAYGRTDYARFYPTPDYSVRRIGTDLLQMGLRSYLRAMRLVFARDYSADWKGLSLPALIVHGSKDSIVPVAHARALAQTLPQAELVEVAEANHILILNNAPEVAELIRDFVGQ